MIRTNIANDIWNMKYRNGEESESEFYRRIVNGLFENDPNLEDYAKIIGVNSGKEFFDYCVSVIGNHKFMLAGRPTHSLGTTKKDQSFSNCFVIPLKNDSMEAIMETAKEAAITFKAGGGIGYDFSILRPKNSMINTTGSCSSGVVSFMRIFDTVCSTIMAGGNRRGAQMGSLSIYHPEVEDFISAKRDGSLSNFNLSVFIPDSFMKAVEADEDWKLVFPDTKFEKYNELWDGNFKHWLDNDYPVIVHKEVKARELYDKIMKSNYNFAEPGILFEDTINRNNNMLWCEYIRSTNPCGEQPLQPYGSCNLGSVNLYNLVENKFEDSSFLNRVELEKVTRCGVIMLDRMLDLNFVPLKEQREEMIRKRAIGLGFTGLADMLAAQTYKYSESSEYIEKVTQYIKEVAYDTSCELAKIKGSFPAYESDKFLKGEFVKKLSPATWNKISDHGVRNSRLISIAPTGTISILMNNISGGIEPIFALEYNRKVKQPDGTTKTEVVENLAWGDYKKKFNTTNVPEFFETTDELNVDDHINMQAAVQKHNCSAISKTINVPVNYDFEDFKNIYIKAWKNGLKGCTTYRPNNVLGSVLEKTEGKNVKKQQKEFFEVWKDHDKDKVFVDDVTLPDEFPMKGFKIKSEGKKWYVSLSFKDKQMTMPFAIFVHTNNREGEIETFDAINRLEALALHEGVDVNIIDLNRKKMGGQTNVTKIARMLGLLLRHNISIVDIVEVLDGVNVPISSFIIRIKKLLMNYIEDEEGIKCYECGGKVKLVEGCLTCLNCGHSKCG